MSEGKDEIQQIEDDLSAFDNLEKNFHKVVSQLVTDTTLDKFREEYERLYEMLVASHNNNQELIDKCKQMNNNILANANKVSSVLTLSQNDQRVIAGLRHEFEKAWKMVEVSQTRETASKEVIDSLKGEIANLSRLVEQGGTVAMTQQTSLEEILNGNDQIKHEIDVQTKQQTKMQNDIEEMKATTTENKKAIDEMKVEIETLQTELQQQRSAFVQTGNEVDQAAQDIKQTKDEIKVAQADYEQLEHDVAKKRSTNDVLKEDYYSEARNKKSAEEDVRANQQQVSTKMKLLADKKKTGQKIIDEMSKYEDKFASKDGTYMEFDKLRSKIQKEREESELELKELVDLHHAIDAERSALHKAVNLAGSEILKLNSKTNTKEMEIRSATYVSDQKVAEHIRLKSQRGFEKKETELAARKCQLTVNELMALKVQAHEDQTKVSTLTGEANEYIAQTMDVRNHISQIEEDVKTREKEISRIKIEIASKEEKTKRQTAMSESLQNERDVSLKLLEKATKDNEATAIENEALAKVVRGLKEEMRMTDQMTIEVHCQQQNVIAQVKKLTKRIQAMEIEIKEMDDEITETRNKISRAQFLLSEGKMDIYKQEAIVKQIAESSKTIERTAVARGRENEVLFEKARVVQSMIEKSKVAFDKLNDEIDAQQDVLDRELAIQRHLLNKTAHSKALRLELIRIEKSLLQERGKRSALEEELEKPLNVHRWRFLDCTNPELSEMMKMTVQLRDTLMTQITKLQKLCITRKKLSDKVTIEEKHLERAYSNDYQEEYMQLRILLREKTRLLAEMENKASSQRAEISEHRDQLSTVRTMVREEKSEVYEVQQKTVRIRAKTAIGTRRKQTKPVTPRADSRFIGGGFAVGGQIPAQNARPETSRRQAKTRLAQSPDLVLPLGPSRRVNENPAVTATKKKPPGWNSNRLPLSPFLSPLQL